MVDGGRGEVGGKGRNSKVGGEVVDPRMGVDGGDGRGFVLVPRRRRREGPP